LFQLVAETVDSTVFETPGDLTTGIEVGVKISKLNSSPAQTNPVCTIISPASYRLILLESFVLVNDE